MTYKAKMLLTALTLGCVSTPLVAKELQYSTHLPPSVAINPVAIVPLFDAVLAADDDLSVKYFWAGQLFNSAGNLEAIRDGVVDVAFTQPDDAQADFPVNMLFADLYHIGDDPYVTAAALNETILVDCPECRAEYASNNGMFMGSHATTPTVMVCADEINSMDDLTGRKVIGQATIANWIQSFNGTQIDVPPPARLEAMERGVADCTLISREWLKTFSIMEVAKTIIPVSNGSQFAISIATMNTDTWADLSDAARAAFIAQMPISVANLVETYVKNDKAAEDEARSKGIVFTDLGGAYKAALDAYLDGFEERVIANAEARGVTNAAEIVGHFTENLAKWEALIAAEGTENYADLLKREIWDKAEF
ncbi:hypothetical protein [Pseudoprimorskyibacter insulae]|uniref:Solute-binding protein n=1 Tax=Pseudoprimorskyibacter insulae TaxID=1695997 RepID=A0A2R8AWN5_9RHOB|nr:hypothetical protein [Pseudoprimorskyibacter insulae]SPF80274.1 hypothetical protein PRI8871_02080 [Pseudoprimorskyibacter insulae]